MNGKYQWGLAGLIMGGALGWALFSLFSQVPFIQQEIVYQAKWWNDPTLPFFTNLFNPDHQDYGIGRFRYIEYLSEALYWKLAHAGWLPRDLYDYAAIAITAVLNFFLWRLARLKGLSPIGCAIISAVLWLSIPTFMITTWHYRKAKPLASLLLVWLAYRAEKSERRIDPGILGLLIVGFFTDPFFILFAPLVLALVKRQCWRSLVVGYAVAFGILVLVNGFIGPAFHPGTKLVLRSIPYKPMNLLNPAQWSLFYQVLPQLLGFPVWSEMPLGAIAFLFVCLLALLGLCYREKKAGAYTLIFLISLPVSAIVVHPSFFRQIGTYCSYYGHATFVLFLLCFTEIWALVESRKNFALVSALIVGAAGVVTLHQIHREDVFESWKLQHFRSQSAYLKYESDYRLLQASKKNPDLAKQLPDLPWQNEELHLYNDGDGQWSHSSLGYILIPLFFENRSSRQLSTR